MTKGAVQSNFRRISNAISSPFLCKTRKRALYVRFGTSYPGRGLHVNVPLNANAYKWFSVQEGKSDRWQQLFYSDEDLIMNEDVDLR